MRENISSSSGKRKRRKGKISFQVVRTASVFILLVALCAVSAVRTRTFFTWNNLVYNLLTNAAYLGIIACGMTLVMIAGGFDLSVGSTTAVCSVIIVLLLRGLGDLGAWFTIPIALLGGAMAGTLLGSFNGVAVAYVGVNPFVVTISTMLIFRGIALVVTYGGQTIMVPLALSDTLRQIYWGRLSLFGSEAYQLPIPILLFVVVFILCFYLLRFTRFGHYIYAVGGNETASWLAGINTSLVKAATYAITGLTCAVAAVIYTGMSSTAQAASYQGLEMLVIASVIVGGTPLGGGRGSLLCTLNGLLLLSVIENLLAQFGVHEEYRNIVRGSIILVAVTVDVLVRRSRRRR
jgi:ribose/xylose/arabinose/galactoside ABC-type transport system permease subunit